MAFNFAEQSHKRFNPLISEWVLVSPHRTDRPWQGQVETVHPEAIVPYDPKCYMCPGNTRANGTRNPDYRGALVFDNDFPALEPDRPGESFEEGLLLARSERGICRVVCFSPRHDTTLSKMEAPAIREVVDTWAAQSAELGGRENIRHVQIFENRGAMMGASNPHPHCQIWATSSVPNLAERELNSFVFWRMTKEQCLLCAYLAQEEAARERLVEQNEHFAALVPFWAVWPFETMVISKRHAGSLAELSAAERDALAGLLKTLTARYDNLFRAPFPYSMGFHQSPTDGTPHEEWHLHAHFYPPLLRSASVRKFMVGFEMLGTPQRDLTAEQAADRLRAVSAG